MSAVTCHSIYSNVETIPVLRDLKTLISTKLKILLALSSLEPHRLLDGVIAVLSYLGWGEKYVDSHIKHMSYR